MSSEENPLLTLPKPIVDALFENAEREAAKAKERILNLRRRLEELKGFFKFREIKGKRSGRIVVADGSMSVAPSRRLGSSFAIYSAGYMVFDGDRLVDEKYYAGSLSWPHGGVRGFLILLRLLMANAERDAALEAYWKHSPDLVLLDGPFFYFRSYCRRIHDVRLGLPELQTGLDLVRTVRDKTLTLMRTGRAVCVIRRSGIRAIDGWLTYSRGEEATLGTSDKHLLTMVMPPMSTWSYREALGERFYIYSVFYWFYRHERQRGKTAKELMEDREKLFNQSEMDLKNRFERDLKLDFSKIPRLERFYVRYSASAPPFEVEAPSGFNVEEFAEYFVDFHNPVTGLPYPVDLIDGAVTLPRGATTMFTEEIEARLVKDREIADKTAISQYFTVLNPQKKEYV